MKKLLILLLLVGGCQSIEHVDNPIAKFEAICLEEPLNIDAKHLKTIAFDIKVFDLSESDANNFNALYKKTPFIESQKSIHYFKVFFNRNMANYHKTSNYFIDINDSSCAISLSDRIANIDATLRKFSYVAVGKFTAREGITVKLFENTNERVLLQIKHPNTDTTRFEETDTKSYNAEIKTGNKWSFLPAL